MASPEAPVLGWVGGWRGGGGGWLVVCPYARVRYPRYERLQVHEYLCYLRYDRGT